jgi:hypothetical protein
MQRTRKLKVVAFQWWIYKQSPSSLEHIPSIEATATAAATAAAAFFLLFLPRLLQVIDNLLPLLLLQIDTTSRTVVKRRMKSEAGEALPALSRGEEEEEELVRLLD